MTAKHKHPHHPHGHPHRSAAARARSLQTRDGRAGRAPVATVKAEEVVGAVLESLFAPLWGDGADEAEEGAPPKTGSAPLDRRAFSPQGGAEDSGRSPAG